MNSADNRMRFDQKIIEKAMKDPDFRKKLLESPDSVLKKEYGITIPGSVKIKVVEEDPQTVYLVLPYLPAPGEEIELTEAETEAVSGGGHTVVIQLCGSYDCTTTNTGG
jgi:hypothetical protein